jgi:hypothetical protein
MLPNRFATRKSNISYFSIGEFIVFLGFFQKNEILFKIIMQFNDGKLLKI